MTEFDTTEPSFYSDKLVPELLKEVQKLTKQVKLAEHKLKEEERSYSKVFKDYMRTEDLLANEQRISKFWRRLSFSLVATIIIFLILGSV